MNKDQDQDKVLIVGCGEVGLTVAIRAQLESRKDMGIVIISRDEEKELQKQNPFQIKDIKIKLTPRLIEPFVDNRNNEPWYTKFKKKKTKKI